jgi:hypothetical protein
VRRLDIGGPLGTVVSTESGRYTASIDAAGRTTGAVESADGMTETVILADDRPSRRGGKWSRKIRSRAGGEELTLSGSSVGGAPAAEWEVTRGNTVVSRTANTWKRVNGVWRLSQHVTTYYQSSKPVLSVTTDFDAGVVGPPMNVVATGSLRTLPDGAASQQYGVCESEMNAVQDAFDVYEASTLGFLACLKGPAACIGAGTAYVLAYRKLVRAFDRADVCLDAY